MGRDKATGQGVVYAMEQWATDNDMDLGKITYFVQGFGNVGSWTARLLAPKGAKLLAVEDHTGSIGNPDGIDAEDLSAYVAKTRRRRRLSQGPGDLTTSPSCGPRPISSSRPRSRARLPPRPRLCST